jgi:DNA-directed RNA polymerase subunit N (RpoN/RPB10)
MRCRECGNKTGTHVPLCYSCGKLMVDHPELFSERSGRERKKEVS